MLAKESKSPEMSVNKRLALTLTTGESRLSHRYVDGCEAIPRYSQSSTIGSVSRANRVMRITASGPIRQSSDSIAGNVLRCRLRLSTQRQFSRAEFL